MENELEQKANPASAPVPGSDAVSLWQADAKDFDAYFAFEKYSLGAMPTWTQIEEMKRTWCNARKLLREQHNAGTERPAPTADGRAEDK
jgi:hypothetical protein